MSDFEKPLNPFVGLHPFTASYYQLFFGREKEIDALTQLASEKSMIVVTGDTGSGKTSLIQAGLIPRLNSQENGRKWFAAYVKPAKRPIENLVAGILESTIEEINPGDLSRFIYEIDNSGIKLLLEFLKPILAGHNKKLLIIIDQLQDLFHSGVGNSPDPEANNQHMFFSFLAKLIDQQILQLCIIPIIRSDYLEDFRRVPGFAEMIDKNQYTVKLMSPGKLRKAIEGPINHYGQKIDSTLIDLILKDVENEKFQLPVLQYLLCKIWETWLSTEDDIINEDHYFMIGHAQNAISWHADNVLSSLKESEKEIAERLFRSLVYIDSKNRMSCHSAYLGDLQKITSIPSNELAKIIDLFYSGGRSFLTISEDILKNDLVVEICHESLIHLWKTLKLWTEKEKKSRDIYLQLIDDATKYKNHQTGLLTASKLFMALNWLKRNNITKNWGLRFHPGYELAIDFLEKSKSKITSNNIKQEKDKGFRLRLKNGVLFAALAFLVLLCFFMLTPLKVYFSQQKHTAKDRSGNAPEIMKSEPESGMSKSLAAIEESDETDKQPDSKKKAVPNKRESQKISAIPGPSVRGKKAHATSAESNANKAPANVNNSPPSKNIFLNSNRYMEEALKASKSNDWLIASHFFALSAKENLRKKEIEICKQNIGKFNKALFLVSQFTPETPIQGAAISNDGNISVILCADSVAYLCHTSDASLARPPMKFQADLQGVIFSPDDRFLLLGDSNHMLQVINIQESGLVSKSLKHKGIIHGATFSQDGKSILSWSADSTVRLRDTTSGKLATKPMKHNGEVLNAIFSHNEQYILSCCKDGCDYLWDKNNGSLYLAKLSDKMKGQSLTGCSFSYDDKYILTWTDHQIMAWSTKTRSLLNKPIEIIYGNVEGACFSHSGEYILSWDAFRFAQLWETKTGLEAINPLVHGDAVLGAKFSDDDSLILTWSKDGKACLWNTGDGSQTIKPIELHEGMCSATFGKDDRMILTLDGNGSARFWYAANGLPASQVMKHGGRIDQAICNDNSNQILTWSKADNTVKIWKMNYTYAVSQQAMSFNSSQNVDFDFPKNSLELMVEVFTGTTLDKTDNLRILKAKEWMDKKENYIRIADNYYRTHNYQHANIYLNQKRIWGK